MHTQFTRTNKYEVGYAGVSNIKKTTNGKMCVMNAFLNRILIFIFVESTTAKNQNGINIIKSLR